MALAEGRGQRQRCGRCHIMCFLKNGSGRVLLDARQSPCHGGEPKKKKETTHTEEETKGEDIDRTRRSGRRQRNQNQKKRTKNGNQSENSDGAKTRRMFFLSTLFFIRVTATHQHRRRARGERGSGTTAATAIATNATDDGRGRRATIVMSFHEERAPTRRASESAIRTPETARRSRGGRRNNNAKNKQ